MHKSERNKQFIIRYYRTMFQAIKEGPEAIERNMPRFIKDQKLIEHIRFFSQSFPGYTLGIEYLLAEGDQVFVKATFQGSYALEDQTLQAAEAINVPFALVYTVHDDMITNFWAIANEMEFFEQLGLTREQVEVRKEELILT